MLWQRFGCGARDKDVQAAALLFVEPKALDQWTLRKDAGGKQLSKPMEPGQIQSGLGRRGPCPRFWMEMEMERKTFGRHGGRSTMKPIGDEKKLKPNQVLDDVINAEGRGIGCRRKPFKVYFDDDECSGLCVLFSCTTLNNILQEFVTVTKPSRGLVPLFSTKTWHLW